eukprot:4689698-Amphidinium_carterae.1
MVCSTPALQVALGFAASLVEAAHIHGVVRARVGTRFRDARVFQGPQAKVFQDKPCGCPPPRRV